MRVAQWAMAALAGVACAMLLNDASIGDSVHEAKPDFNVLARDDSKPLSYPHAVGTGDAPGYGAYKTSLMEFVVVDDEIADAPNESNAERIVIILIKARMLSGNRVYVIFGDTGKDAEAVFLRREKRNPVVEASAYYLFCNTFLSGYLEIRVKAREELCRDVHFEGWCSASVFHNKNELHVALVMFPRNRTAYINVGADPRTLVGDVGVPGNSIRLAGLPESPDQKPRSDEGQGRANECRYYLPISGCSRYVSRLSGFLLGSQILSIMLVGFGFTCGVVFGLVNALDNPNRNRRRLGWVVAALCAPLGLTFYGWAWLGHPLAFWGLR